MTTEFTIGIPQISAEPVFKKDYTELAGFGSDNLISVGISDPYIIAGNHSSTKKPQHILIIQVIRLKI